MKYIKKFFEQQQIDSSFTEDDLVFGNVYIFVSELNPKRNEVYLYLNRNKFHVYNILLDNNGGCFLGCSYSVESFMNGIENAKIMTIEEYLTLYPRFILPLIKALQRDQKHLFKDYDGDIKIYKDMMLKRLDTVEIRSIIDANELGLL